VPLTVVGPRGLEPRTCGLRVPEKSSRAVHVRPPRPEMAVRIPPSSMFVHRRPRARLSVWLSSRGSSCTSRSASAARDLSDPRLTLTRCRFRESLSDPIQFKRITRRHHPRSRKSVALPSRHNVNVEVEDVLPSRRTVRLEDREAVWPKRGTKALGHRSRQLPYSGRIRGRELPDVLRVVPRHDQRVSLGSGVHVEERQRAVVVIDGSGRSRSRDDVAEDALTHVRSRPTDEIRITRFSQATDQEPPTASPPRRCRACSKRRSREILHAAV